MAASPKFAQVHNLLPRMRDYAFLFVGGAIGALLCWRAGHCACTDEKATRGLKAFYGTSFGMSAKEVAEVIPVPLFGCEDLVHQYQRSGGVPPFEFKAHCQLDGFRAVDQALAHRTLNRFARGLTFLNESFDAAFEFRDGQLYMVAAEFDLGGYQSPLMHHEALVKQLQKRLATSYGQAQIEASNDAPGAAHFRYKGDGVSAVLFSNPTTVPPLLSLAVINQAMQDRYEAAKKQRDESAL